MRNKPNSANALLTIKLLKNIHKEKREKHSRIQEFYFDGQHMKHYSTQVKEKAILLQLYYSGMSVEVTPNILESSAALLIEQN